jgi:Ca-activated chloride channel family protein
MAKVSNGTAMSISNSDDITGRLIQTADMLSHQAYRDIAINIDGVKVRDISPAQIGSLYRGQQLIIFGHYWGHGPAQVSIEGKVSAEKKIYRTGFDFPETSTLHPEVERMWAFASIEELQNRIDYLGDDSDSEQAIIDLALEYGLVTDYTSMVVVREQAFGQYNISRKNKARVEQEHGARQQRVGQPVRDNRQDTQQPAFNNNRAFPKSGGGSGAGALGPWGLLLLLPLLLLNRRKYQ